METFMTDYSWIKNTTSIKPREANLIETEITDDEEKIDLLLVGLSTMTDGWMFVWEKDNKEHWVWFDEKNYRYIPIPKIDLPLSYILGQKYFNFGSIGSIMHDIGYDIIEYRFNKNIKQFKPFTGYITLKAKKINLKGVYIKRKGEVNYEFIKLSF